MSQPSGSVIVGLLLCWSLNVVHLGVAILLFFSSERLVPSAVILIAAIGVLQIAYVVPVYRLLRRRGKSRTARGLATAAWITVFANAVCWGAVIVEFHLL